MVFIAANVHPDISRIGGFGIRHKDHPSYIRVDICGNKDHYAKLSGDILFLCSVLGDAEPKKCKSEKLGSFK
jgi:hypothetical protein